MKWTKWNVHMADDEKVRALSSALSLPRLAARLLVSRGIDSEIAARDFLRRDMEIFHNPFLLPDMNRAVERIKNAIAGDEKIAVFGDYDVDGITATYIVYDYLKRQGARVDYYIPDRIDEGYGVNSDALNKLIDNGVTLVITVDTGITAHDEVAQAKLSGCDVVVTDHHECRDTLPNAVAVVNPHRADSTYPFCAIAGVGVAFKLLCAISGRIEERYLPFVCIGTIADVMPVCNENRAIIYEGLKMLENTEHVGLRALIAKAGISGKALSSDSIGFGIAPRINAAGRMQHAAQVIELFEESDARVATEKAQALCDLNIARQSEEKKIFDEALEKLPEVYDSRHDYAIVLEGEGWHHGVIGIVASRLSNRFECPVILLAKHGDVAKGSGRSIEGMNLYAALCGASEYLTQYGGHEMAVGLTLSAQDIPKLRDHINKCAKNELCDYVSQLDVDFEAKGDELNVSDIESLSCLEPFGMGNLPPLVCMRNVLVESVSPMGKGRHLKFFVSKDRMRFEAVYFGKSIKDISFTQGDAVDLLFKPEVNDFRGKNTQLLLRDIRPVEAELTEMCEADKLYSCVKEKKAEETQYSLFSPSYDELGLVWRAVSKFAKQQRELPVATLKRILCGKISYEKIFVAIDVFCELGLMKCIRNGFVFEVEILPISGKVNLEDSEILRDIALLSNGMMI